MTGLIGEWNDNSSAATLAGFVMEKPVTAFVYFPSASTWTDARDLALAEDGQLATLQTVYENRLAALAATNGEKDSYKLPVRI